MLQQLIAEKPSVCAVLYASVRDYYADPEHEREFENWYKETYGKEYEPERRPAVRNRTV